MGRSDDRKNNFYVSGPKHMTQTEVDWYARLYVLAFLLEKKTILPFRLQRVEYALDLNVLS